MATVTKSIGTSSRDYSTITLWEADLDNTLIYNSGDDAVGECYNDSVFTDGNVNINGGGTVGLNSITLSVASTERHDGTEGTGARWGNVQTSDHIAINTAVDCIVEWLDIYKTAATGNTTSLININTSSGTKVVRYNLFHSVSITFGSVIGIEVFGSAHNIHNNIVYDLSQDATGSSSVTGMSTAGGNANYYNNTVANLVNDQGTGACLGIQTGASSTVTNCIAMSTTGTSTGSKNNFSGTPETFSMSEDSTANGANCLINKVFADQFVSVVGGSEDYHLKSGADAIGAATDLAATPDGVQYDINGSNRNALSATVWDMGAHQYASTASIGTSSRDYSTITLWEADLDDTTIYGAGANAVGECYNDSTFDETVTIDGGTTVGLNSATLTVAAGERHDGTAGTGARSVATASRYIYLWSADRNCKWLELDGNSLYPNRIVCLGGSASYTASNLLIHSLKNHGGIGGNQRPGNIHNNIIYDASATAVNPGTDFNCFGIRFHLSSNVFGGYIYNNTVYKIVKDNGDGDAIGIEITGGDRDALCRNNISVDCSGTSSGTIQSFSLTTTGTISNNLSSDTSATGTGSITSAVTADQFVSIVAGSEDLHLKARADAIGAGTDLGTTPDGVQYDINGSNRNALSATVWDIGAHQYASTASIGTSSRDYSTIALWEADLDDGTIYGAGGNAVGECYNDSAFDEAVTIDGGATVGLASTELTVASSERHDGTEGTGARIVRSTDTTGWIIRNNQGSVPSGFVRTVAWLEVDANGNNATSGFINGNTDSATQDIIKNTISHGQFGVGGGLCYLMNRGGSYCVNNILYDCTNTLNGGGNVGLKSGTNSENWHNNTVYKVKSTAAHTSGYSYGADFASVTASNNIVVDCVSDGSAATADFDGTSNYSLSSDSSAAGANSLTNKTAANQFVSIVAGSEDLHLKAGADAIGAGEDLAATPDGVQYDINGSNRNALSATVWDIGAHQYASTASIGTSSRDYSTITLWEADLDDTTVYGAGGNAVGECYNDSTFNESVTINGGGAVGLGSITLSVAVSERHDGTAGTGAVFDASSWPGLKIFRTGMDCVIEWLEVTSTTSSSEQTLIHIDQDSSSIVGAIKHLIVHDAQTSSNAGRIIRDNGSLGRAFNCIAYDLQSSGSACTIFYDPSNRANYYHNVTIHNCGTVSPGGSSSSIGIYARTGTRIKNTLCTDMLTAGAGTATSWGTGGTEYVTNATTDTAGDITGVVAADTYVSVVSGSEDLHLKAGADAIDAGTDLGTTPDGVQYDINGSNRNALTATVWDIGAHQYASTASIGTSSRDYSTITLWEADLDDTTVYGAGANAVGECYNDSAFDESVTIDGGGTAGLSSVTLTVAETERHDGTAGSGARNVSSSHRKISFFNPTCQVNELSWLEWDDNGGTLSTNDALVDLNTSDGPTVDLKNLILHGAISTHVYSHQLVRITNRTESRLANLIVYDLENTSGSVYNKTVGISLNALYDPQEVYNCTVHNMRATGGSASAGSGGVGFGFADDKEYSIRNCIATDCTASGGGIALCFQQSTVIAATLSNNLSSDATASGTGSITNAVTANQFVSIVSGSEDLHLKSGADAIGAGADLGTTPDGVQYDINGSNRNALTATVWDIGAHQYASTASIGTSSRDYSTITLWEADLDDTTVYVAGANAIGECYNDSTFDEYNIVLNGGQTVGLNSVELTVAETERHDGTAGTGAKIDVSEGVLASSVIAGAALDNRYLKWLEITRSNITSTRPLNGVLYVRYIDALIVHDIYNTSASYKGPVTGIYSTWSANYQVIASNCIVYNIEGARDTSGFSLSRNDDQVLNNTVYNIKRTDASALYDCYGIRRALNTPTIKNCISVGTNAEFGSFGDFTGGFTQEYNLSSDSTASGTGSITNAVTADQFVSIVSGSEDLHLKTGSDAINAGVYLTTPDAIQYDIDGDLRGNFGLFSIGADEFVLVIDNTPDIKGSIIRVKSPSPVRPSYKTGYAKSASESAYPDLWDGLQHAWFPVITGCDSSNQLFVSDLKDIGPKKYNLLWRRGNVYHDPRGIAYTGTTNNEGYQSNATTGHEFSFKTSPRFCQVSVIYVKSLSSYAAYTSVGLTNWPSSNQTFLWRNNSSSGRDIRVILKTTGASFDHVSGLDLVEGVNVLAFQYDDETNVGQFYVNGDVVEFTEGSGTTEPWSKLQYFGSSTSIYALVGSSGNRGQGVILYDRWLTRQELDALNADPLAPFRQRRSVPYRKLIIDPAETLTELGLTATPFKSYTITDKGIVVEDANGKQFLMFVF